MCILQWRKATERFIARVYSRLARRSFKSCGSLYLHPTARVDNARFISIGGANIGRHVWLYAMVHDTSEQSYEPEISIGTGTFIQDFSHITCARSLTIGDQVLIGRSVLITDSIHNYEDINLPVVAQGLRSRPTSVGDGSWVGNHAVIIGCHVGRHCVVSANAVVTKDVPDFCVVGGVPARILKRYDAGCGEWVRVEGEAARLSSAAVE